MRVLPLQRDTTQSKRPSEALDMLDIPSRKSLPQPIACYIIDILDGKDKEASIENMTRFREAQNQPTQIKSKSSFAGHFYRLTVSTNQVRSDNGWNGKHIMTVESSQITNTSLDQRSGRRINNQFDRLILIYSRFFDSIGVSQGPFDYNSIHPAARDPHQNYNKHTIKVGLAPSPSLVLTFPSSLSPLVNPFQGTSEFSILASNNLELWTLSSTQDMVQVDVVLEPLKPKPTTSNANIVTWLFGGAPMSPDEFDSMSTSIISSM
jgi:hypothetical protein